MGHAGRPTSRQATLTNAALWASRFRSAPTPGGRFTLEHNVRAQGSKARRADAFDAGQFIYRPKVAATFAGLDDGPGPGRAHARKQLQLDRRGAIDIHDARER